MEPYDAYTTMIAVKTHFSSGYDYFKYNGIVSATKESFLISKKKYAFVKLSRNWEETELPYFLALTFMNHGKAIWVSEVNKNLTYTKEFTNWKNWQEQRMENFRSDLTIIQTKYKIETLDHFAKMMSAKDLQMPKIFVEYEERSIDLSTLIILDHQLDLFKTWNTHLQNNFLWDSFYEKVEKFKPFFKTWRPLADINVMKVIKECLK